MYYELLYNQRPGFTIFVNTWSGRPDSNRHAPASDAGEINHSSTSRFWWHYGIRTHVWNFFPGATIRCLNLSAKCHAGTTRIERVPSELQSDAQITTTYATCPLFLWAWAESNHLRLPLQGNALPVELQTHNCQVKLTWLQNYPVIHSGV